MLHSKDTTILSEINDFFISSEKAIETVFSTLRSLKLSENVFLIKEKQNNTYKNTDKLLLMLLFPVCMTNSHLCFSYISPRWGLGFYDSYFYQYIAPLEL